MSTYLKKLLTDPLFRRMLLATCFAGAFVWVAIYAFEVETDVVIRFLLLSVGLVVAMIGGAFLAALLVRMVKRLFSDQE